MTKSKLVKCNAGHESNAALWDCPVCTEQIKKENEVLKKTISRLKLILNDSAILIEWYDKNEQERAIREELEPSTN